MFKIRPALLLAGATTVAAFNATGPFGVHITGKTDSSIDGYAGACHAGAAIEGLCYIEGAISDNNYQQFYFNYSSVDFNADPPYAYGWLEWELLTTIDNENASVPEALQIVLDLGSNVNVVLFYPGYDDYTTIQHSTDGTLFISGGVDDSNFNATYPNPVPQQGDLTNWYLCWQFTGGYYQHSIAWVTSAPPQNPSCEAVDLTLVAFSAPPATQYGTA